MRNTIAAASWSSGKDSCLALYRALQEGYSVRYLVNFTSKDDTQCCFHKLPAGLMAAQATSIGIALIQKEITEYEKEFKQTLAGLTGVKAMIFGDIYLEEHKDWVEKTCSDIGMKAVEPLWGGNTRLLVKEFLAAGFKTVIISCQAQKMGKEFIGREVDEKLIEELEGLGVCPCGEKGEFHTFVVDGPLFSERIEITQAEPILREDHGNYWFLDIKQYKCVQKNHAGRGSPGAIPGTVAQR